MRNWLGANGAYGHVLDTDADESCLAKHVSLLNAYEGCLVASEPDYAHALHWSVGHRECMNGGGQCGPPTPTSTTARDKFSNPVAAACVRTQGLPL